MRAEVAAVWIALASLCVSLALAVAQYWGNLFPSSKTIASISTLQWGISEDRLGKGPRAIAKIHFSNTGNIVVNIEQMHVKFALGEVARIV